MGVDVLDKEHRDGQAKQDDEEEDEVENKEQLVKEEMKPLRCHALLDGLPGAPDPKPNRNRTRTVEERVNPVVKKKQDILREQGVVSKKEKEAKLQRAAQIQQKKNTAAERKTRRRTKFDFDLWDAPEVSTVPASTDEETKVDPSWISDEAKVHTNVWTAKHVPKESKHRKLDTGSLIPAVEVPDAGASYNPALADHQDLLWKAALVEINKEKALKKIERQTTDMFPTKENAPTKESYIKEMSEGIAELGGVVDEDEEEEEGMESDEESEAKINKPKTRKQRRDTVKRAHADRKRKSMLSRQQMERDIFKLKTYKKELNEIEAKTLARQKVKEAKAEEKRKNPLQLTKYKYEPQEIEIKLSDELTGNLRSLKPEGSLLEDRYKSLQRRNIVETRIKQKEAKGWKKKVEKRNYKMGWETNQLRKTKKGGGKKKKMKMAKVTRPLLSR